MTSEKHDCNDCGVAPGTRHVPGCDVARCTECGYQYIGCGCPQGDPTIWTGIWPGELECYEFGWVTSPDSIWGVGPDLNRLYSSAQVAWDKNAERWVLRG